MTIPTISQVISAIASVLHRDTINPTIPATQDNFVNSVETFYDKISETTVGELNTLKTEINTTVSAMNTVANEVQNNAIIATGLANYQGVWSNIVTYSKGQSVSNGTLFYTSKVDSNLNHAVTDTNYWIPNPINDKVALSGNQTIAGLKTFSDGFISTSATQPIGHATGAGGTVTQSTSKSTAVTLNKPCGQITMNNAALAAGAIVVFTFNNNMFSGNTDTLIFNINSGLSNVSNYSIRASIRQGSCDIAIKNETAVSLSEPVGIQFVIIKGANS